MPPAVPQTSLLREKPTEAQIAVLEERLNNVRDGVDRNHESTQSGLKDVMDRVEKLGTDLLSKLEAKYATKAEVAEVKERLKSVQSSLSWAVKLVVGSVIAGVLGVVMAKGGLHP